MQSGMTWWLIVGAHCRLELVVEPWLAGLWPALHAYFAGDMYTSGDARVEDDALHCSKMASVSINEKVRDWIHFANGM